MRASFDVDILIHEEDLDKAIEVLQTKAEMVFDHRAYHDVVMRNATITLELHFSLKETMDNIDRMLDRVWEYAVPDEGSRYAMTPEYFIFHNVAHMVYHFSHGGLGVRP